MAAGSGEAFAESGAPPPAVVDVVPAAVDGVAAAVAETPRADAADTVEVVLFDENHPETRKVRIGRDGSVDDATRQLIEHLFRCKRTDRNRSIDQGLLAKLAAVAAQYPGQTIEFVSAYRATERHTSRHYQGRALDFRIKGVPMADVRDYVWGHLKHLGLGWYPDGGFIHMDHREDDKDIAWTSTNGSNHYHPTWSKRVQRGESLRVRESRVGL